MNNQSNFYTYFVIMWKKRSERQQKNQYWGEVYNHTPPSLQNLASDSPPLPYKTWLVIDSLQIISRTSTNFPFILFILLAELFYERNAKFHKEGGP